MATEQTVPELTAPVLDESMVEEMRESAKWFQDKHWRWPPELTQIVTDHSIAWAKNCYTELVPWYVECLIAKGTEKDFEDLLATVFTDDIWTALRRSFFMVVHNTAIELEAKGWEISEELASFYRKRYNPPHKFKNE